MAGSDPSSWPSSWEVYYVVFLSALLALGIPALLGFFSYLVSIERRHQAKPGRTPTENRRAVADRRKSSVRPPEPEALSSELLQKRINARFFLGVNAALVLLAQGLALIPCAGMLRSSAEGELFFKGLVAIVSLACACGLGLLYSSKKGDLSWIRSFHASTPGVEDKREAPQKVAQEEGS